MRRKQLHMDTRSDVVNTIVLAAHTMNMPKVKRAYEEGNIEFLGGFKRVCKDSPGWVVMFNCGDPWSHPFYMGVVYRGQWPITVPLETVNWADYDGYASTNPLYMGDHAEQYKQLKKEGVVWPVAENQQMTV